MNTSDPNGTVPRQRSSIKFYATALLIVGAIQMSTSPALAEDAIARQHFDKAIALYNLQHFEKALEYFSAAYLEKPDPAFLFNIAQCQRQLERYDAAARSYRAYLYQSPPSAPNRAQAARLAEQMDEALRTQRAAKEAPPPGAVTPARAPELAPAPPAIAAARPPRGAWYKSRVGWGLVAGGVACGFASAALLTVAASEGAAAERATTRALFDSHHSSDMRYQSAGWPLLGIGAASVVVGGIVMAVRR